MREHLEVISAIKRELDKKGMGKLMYLCVSGSDSYGWNTEESDIDYRGIFIADTNKLLGLDRVNDIFELEIPDKEQLELINAPPPIFGQEEEAIAIRVKTRKKEIVLFELKKAIELILQGNSNVMEWFYSKPVYTTQESLRLKKLVDDNVTKQVYNAYKGMATYNYKKFIKQGKNTTKKYLYIFRALMAGIYALKEGKIEPNIYKLDKYFDSDWGPVLMLVNYKKANAELDEETKRQIEKTLDVMFEYIDTAYEESKLPDEPDREAFNKLLLNIRRRN